MNEPWSYDVIITPWNELILHCDKATDIHNHLVKRSLIETRGVISTFFLGGGQNFFIFFNATGLLKNWKKQHFICSNLTLFMHIVPFFLFSFFLFFSFFSFFLFFFLFIFIFFFLGWGGGDGPQPLSNRL